MNPDLHMEPTMNQLSEAAQKATSNAKDVARDVSDSAQEAARSASEIAKEIYQTAALKAEDTFAVSKNYVRRNPVPVVLGAVAFGMAVGYMLMMARRRPTFGEQYVEEPLCAVRDSILGVLAPVSKRVHKGYDSARDGAGKAMDRLHSFAPGRNSDSFSDQVGRISHNLKFW